MRLNGAALDGSALNGAVGRAIQLATCTGSAGASASALAVQTYQAAATNSAGATITAAVLTYEQMATASGSAGLSCVVDNPGVGTASTVDGVVNGAALNTTLLDGASLYFLALGDVSASAGATASATAVVTKVAAASNSASLTATATVAKRTAYCTVAASAGLTATAPVGVKRRPGAVADSAGATANAPVIKLFVKCALSAGALAVVGGSGIQSASCSASAGALATARGNKTTACRATASAGLLSDILAVIETHAAAAINADAASGTAIGVRRKMGAATGAAGLSATAVTAAIFGAATGAAGLVGTVSPTLHKFVYAVSNSAGLANNAPVLNATCNGHASASCGATGYGDWKYQATGSAIWIWDGKLVGISATTTGYVDPSLTQVFVTLGSISSGFFVGVATATHQKAVSATTTAGAAGTASCGRLFFGGVAAPTAGMTGTAIGANATKGTALNSCGATVIAPKAWMTRAAQAANDASMLVSVGTPLMNLSGRTAGVATLTGAATGRIASVRAYASDSAGATIYSITPTQYLRQWGTATNSAECTSAADSWKLYGQLSTLGGRVPLDNGVGFTLVNATAWVTTQGTAAKSAGITITVASILAKQVPAPVSRTMRVPYENRTMVVPYDNRLMRVAA